MRLVDVDVIIKDLTAMKRVYDAIELDGMIKALKEAPTIEAEPVQHGEWIWHDNEEAGDLTGTWGYHECSNCHFGTIDRLPYCGHCGTKMDLTESGCCENEPKYNSNK